MHAALSVFISQGLPNAAIDGITSLRWPSPPFLALVFKVIEKERRFGRWFSNSWSMFVGLQGKEARLYGLRWASFVNSSDDAQFHAEQTTLLPIKFIWVCIALGSYGG